MTDMKICTNISELRSALDSALDNTVNNVVTQSTNKTDKDIERAN